MKSIKTPFTFSGGKVETTSNQDVIARQKISDVLLTSNYERVLRPRYGANMYSLVHQLADENDIADVKVEAMFDLADNISTLSVIDIQFDTGSVTTDDPTLNVNVLYKLPLGTLSTTSISIAVPGLITEDTPF